MLLLATWCLGSLQLPAQSDTLLLPELTVEGRDPLYFLPGGVHWQVDGDSTWSHNLSQRLSDEFPWYFVEYGAPGQLSSVNLRGLGPSRTSVLWNGMEINSFTLGQTDFGELMPTREYNMGVALGAVSALFGSGALGGTVSLGSSPTFAAGNSFKFSLGGGSFGHYASDATFKTATSRTFSSTGINYRQSQNDFPYTYQDQKVRQNNAGYRNWGIFQDLYHRAGNHHALSGHFWYRDFSREIQPPKGDFQSQQQLENRSLLSLVQWFWTPANWVQNLSLGYTRDEQVFNDGTPILVRRGYASYSLLWNRSTKFQLKAGSQVNFLKASAENFQKTVDETRIDYHASLMWIPQRRLKAGVSLRLPQIDSNLQPLTPLASVSYVFGDNDRRRWKLDGQISRSYRVPTLNDRYWQPGGNVDLKPELSHNWETGIAFDWEKNIWSYQGAFRYYRHQVENWIIWIPGGRSETEDGQIISFWYPDNVREVLAQGVEAYHTLQYHSPANHWKSGLKLRTSYRKAVNKKAISGLDRSLDKQLPYTPRWTVNGSWWIAYRQWNAGLQGQYQGARFTEANNELPPLPAFTLWNLYFTRVGNWGRVDWSASFQLRNLFNKQYENFENRAMPGRNYNINLKFKLHSYKSDNE